VEHAGVASAINNAISDVGPQLAVAALFVVMTANFYTALAQRVPGLDVASPAVRREVAPLNVPERGAPEEVRRAARDASTGVFHLAMIVSAVLLLGGGAINAAGIQTPVAARAARVVSPDPLWRRFCHVTADKPAGGAAAPRSAS
jgi:hypothetical protein